MTFLLAKWKSKPPRLTKGNSKSQTMKNASRVADVMLALAGRVFSKFCQELPKMHLSMTDRIDAP